MSSCTLTFASFAFYGVLLFGIFFVSPLPADAQTPAPSRYDQVKNVLKQMALKFPQNVTPVVVGPSDSGENVVGLAIGHGLTHNLVVATHHGNEYGATDVALAFAEALAQDPIPDQTVFVVPVLNISGYNMNNRLEFVNGAGYDPNRDYPGPCGTSGPFKLKSTRGLAQFVDTQNVIASATLHTFFPAVVYPWGVTTHQTSTLYDNEFEGLALAATEWSHYKTGNDTQTIYLANGTYEDYTFWKDGMWTLLFEVGTTHTPNSAQVNELIKVNVPGLHEFLIKAPHVRAPNHAFTGSYFAGAQRIEE